jgi:DNA invertase Pin-like site-specific DNA recombinase
MSSHVIYARKSSESDDRQVLSIDSQVQELKLLALRRGLTIDEVITEAHSAKAPGRPVFGTLMRRVAKGEIAGIFCWKMDRLARNHFDTGQVLQALADKKLEQVVTPERAYTADGNDRFLGNFEFGIATKFIDDLRTNVKRGNRARFQQGWPNFRPPIGYLEDRATKTVVNDPERFPLVRRMWDELLSGRMKPMQISRTAEKDWGLRTRKTAHLGGKPLSFQYVFRLFANPYYMGLIQLRNGETYKGAHEPMVTPDEFEGAQALLGRPGRSRPSRHSFAYAGMLSCGLCNRTLVPEEHVKRSGKRFVYYRCRGRTDDRPCPNPCLPEVAFEQQLEADLRRLTLPRKAVQWIVDNIRPSLDATLSQQTAQRSALEKALADSKRESDALLTLKLRGQVDDDTFERRRLDLLDRQAKFRLQLDQPSPPPGVLLGRVQEVLNFSASLPQAFREGDAVRRRQILHAICANPTVRDKKALYKANEPFSFFEGSGLINSWCTVLERVRTWIVERNFQLPALLLEPDAGMERLRRAGVTERRKRSVHTPTTQLPVTQALTSIR